MDQEQSCRYELQATGELTNPSISQVTKFSISIQNIVKQCAVCILLWQLILCHRHIINELWLCLQQLCAGTLLLLRGSTGGIYCRSSNLGVNEILEDWKSVFVISLFKGGYATVLSNYRLISKLSVLSKVLETLVIAQVKEHLVSNSILSVCPWWQLVFERACSVCCQKLKVFLGFYHRNKSCFSFYLGKGLEAAFLPVLDYGDVLYMSAFAKSLHMLDNVHHHALRFTVKCGFLIHRYILHSKVKGTSLSTCRLAQW